MFRGYYPPSDDEMDRIWDDGLIVLDTNALLNILRYSAATRDELLELLDKKKNQIWLPHQVGLEFHRRRRGTPGELTKAFDAVQAALAEAESNIEGALRSLGRNARQEALELGTEFSEQAKKLKKKLKRARKKHAEAVTADHVQTATFNRISEIYEGRVGPPYDKDELKDLFKDGQARYDKQIPPGYRDNGKKDDSKYGDFVLWRQILDHAKNAKRPLVFVTDDNKEDWWEIASGKTIGARPELIEEYFDASGERAHFYNLRRYLEFAKKRGEKISEESVSEARRVSTHPASLSMVARMEHQARSASLMRWMAKVAPDLTTSEARSSLIAAMSKNLPADVVRSAEIEALLEKYGDTWVNSINRHHFPSVANVSLDDRLSRLYSEDFADYLFEEATPEERERRRAVLRRHARHINRQHVRPNEQTRSTSDGLDSGRDHPDEGNDQDPEAAD